MYTLFIQVFRGRENRVNSPLEEYPQGEVDNFPPRLKPPLKRGINTQARFKILLSRLKKLYKKVFEFWLPR